MRMSRFLRRRGRMLIVVIGLVVVSTTLGQPRDGLGPGMETTVQVPGSPTPAVVYLPPDYSDQRPWPVIFFYPPLGSGPTLQPIKQHTGGTDYILVGMAYLEPEIPMANPQQTEQYWQQERANFLKVLSWITTRVKCDPARIYMGGMIKGAWATARVAELELQRIAGMILLLSARQRNAPQPSPALLRGKLIYVGIGETDPSLLAALQTAEFYRRNGARVTLEQYWGVGHAVPSDAPLLKAWLLAQACSGQAPENQATLEKFMREQYEAALAETDALRKYRKLSAIGSSPLLAYMPQPFVSEVAQKIAVVRQESPGKEEWVAEKTFFDLLWRELNVKKLDEMRNVRDDFMALADAYPQTRFGKLAGEVGTRVAEAYERSLAASRQMGGSKEVKTGSPAPRWQFPSVDTKRVKTPKKIGNKIVFE